MTTETLTSYLPQLGALIEGPAFTDHFDRRVEEFSSPVGPRRRRRIARALPDD